MSERLALVADEYTRAIGRDNDELNAQREKALNYAKGVMDDVPALANRSKAVSTDVADAVETVLPDLVEIYTGEDIATFSPVGPEDEDAAAQETDYVQHVFFNENPGFLILYSAIKDAVLVKTGVIKWWGEEVEAPEERFEGQTVEQWAGARQKYGERVEVVSDLPARESPEAQTFSGPIDFVIKAEKRWKACVSAVPPEDFGVSKDTVRLPDSPYCYHRTRLRAYDLIKRGVSKDKVDALPAYGVLDNGVEQARERTGETVEDAGGIGDHRMVEVVEHYLNGPDGRYRLLTDGKALTLLEEEKHEWVPFAALTPYLVPHQFVGESVADKLLEVQKVKTVLTRMVLDSGYFALNQRPYVDMDQINDWTIPDLLRNEPGMPIRGKGQSAVTYMTSGALSFDAFGALEYMSVVGEGRTGIVRNAQGLNPDTLHDTAKGAMALMTAAQKRIRLIARIFAETGLKDLFVGLHALIRQNATAASTVRLRGKWVDVDPTSWGTRSDMTIEIGVGSAGKEAQAAQMQMAMEAAQQVIAMQGGVDGPFITSENAYNLIKRFFEKGLDFKSADPFVTDPSTQPPKQPTPDPAMLEVEAKLKLERAKIDGQREIAQIKAQSEIETVRAVAAEKASLSRQEAEEKALLNRQQHEEAMTLQAQKDAAELRHKQAVAAVELQLKRDEMVLQAELQREANRMNAAAADTDIDGPRLGGDPG